ncbi:MAG TPA: dephospho-CoA kinase [Thermomicrobiaceae bacterium]|nr:dephospho-CoA kinase [Thermomicrobiaceae bacterium]
MTSDRPYVIGLTGNIATGKSLVLKHLAELGAETIDADLVAHQIMQPGTPTAEAIIAEFGEEIRGQDGGIDRRKLGSIVFSDPAKLARLDEIAHPPTVAAIRRQVEVGASRVVVIDAIKLYEAGLDRDCDEVWAVYCDPGQQLSRLMARNHLDRDEALRRISAQPPQEEKTQRASRIIDNSGTAEETARQVDIAWESLPVSS